MQLLKRVASLNDEALSENTDPDYQIQYIDIGNVNSDGKINEIMPYQFRKAPSRARRLVQDGDVIVSTVRTYLQAIAPIENPPANLVVSTGFAVVRPDKSKLDTDFCKYALRESRFLYEVVRRSTGINYPAINTSELGNIPINVPPLFAQKAIAEYLDEKTAVIDQLITAKERLLTLLDEKRRALITHAVTRGLDTAVPLRDSGVEWIGRVPQHWEIASIKYTAEVGNGSTPKRDNKDYWDNGTFPWLTSTVVNDNIVQEPTQFVTELALRECHLPIVPARSVLVAITGQGKTRGNAALLPYQATINQHMVYISPRQRILNPEYLNNYLFGVYEVLRMISEGSGSTRGAITVQQIAEFPILLPPVVEQQEIVHYLEGWTHHFVRPVFRDVRPTLQDARRKKRDGFETRVPLFATQDPNSGTSVPKNETPPIIGLVLAPVN